MAKKVILPKPMVYANSLLSIKRPLNCLNWLFKYPGDKNILIFSRIKDIKEKEYYLKATAGNAWSRSVLVNQIKADAYQVYLENPKKHNFNLALPEHLAEQADETLKSRYNLDFLGVTKPILEIQNSKT